MPGPGDPKPLTAKDLNPSTGSLRRHGVILGGQSQSKYDEGSTLSDLRNLNAYRAANQGFWDAFGNTTANLVTTLGGQVVQTIGAFADPIMNWMTTEQRSLNEGLMGIGNDIMQYGQNQYPIYYDPSKGYDTDYFLSNLPNFASNVAMLIPGWGVARGMGMLARVARLGALGTKAVQVGVAGSAMRTIEGMMEASQVYNQLIKEGVEGMDPKYKHVGYDEIKRGAIAGAKDTYDKNKINVLFDMLQMGALLMPIKGLTGWGKGLVGGTSSASKASQLMNYGYKALVEKGLLKDASKLSRMGLKGLNLIAPFARETSEGIEEMVNFGAAEEGLRTGRIAMGVQEDDGSTIFDRIKGYMGDEKMWEAGAWGVLGGVVFHAGGQKLNQIGAKAGWWKDTTTRGQVLADLKVRADVISNGYRQLKDPNLTEYDKSIIKGQMLFNLVDSNKSRESLDMLKEDLNDPKMVKKFAELMGFNEEEARAEMETLKKDIDFINDRIDYYTGDTLKNWFGAKPTVHEGVGMEGDKSITNPGVGRSGMLRGSTPTSVHHIFDPKVAKDLAYNDYTIHVKDRLTEKANVEIAGLQRTAFQGTEHDANSQLVFNTVSDITALNHLAIREREELESRKARGLSERFIKASENKVKKVDELLAKREKQLKALEETMNANTEANLSGTTFKEANKYADDVLGAKDSNGKHSGLKAMTFGFMLDKEEALLSNNQILKDPDKYINDYMESTAANKIWEDMRKAETDRAAAEQATIDSAIAELEKDSNDKYRESKARHGEAIAQGLARYATSTDKEGYLMRERDALIADYNEDLKNGKFNRKNLTEFSTQFDKNKYSDLKARESVINAALKEYQKETTTVGATAKPGAAAVDPVLAPVDKTNIVHMPTEPGTAANYWKGMVNKFGADGKSGTFHTQYLNGDGGVAYNIKTSDRYRTNIDALTNILSRYEAVKKDASSDPMEILGEARRYLEFRSWPTKVVTEATVYSTIVEDLQKQEADLTKMDVDLMLAPVDSKMWMLFVGMSAADVARMQAASDADVANIKHGKLDEIPSTFARYPELYPFAKSLITPYTDTHQLFDDLKNIEAKILAEVKRAKEAYETGAAQEAKVPNKDVNNQDPNIHSIMDQKADVNDDSALATHAPMSDPVTHPDNPVFAGILGESIVQLEKNAKGSYEPVYQNGKQQPNPKYDIGHTIYVGPNGETMNGYVKRGTPIIVQYTGRNVSKDIDEKELIMTDEKGRFLGYVDNVDRLTKSNATYQAWVDDPKTSKKKKKEYRGRIKKNEALIPYYNTLRARFTAAGQKLHGNVADQITTATNVVESGGVRYGRLIDTERNDGKAEYMDIAKSFGLSQINRPGKVFLVMYVDGDMVAWNPKSNTYESIYTIQKKMSVPTFALNPKILQGKGTLNGSIFAMIPTNTLDSNGDHIYVSAKMYTRLVTNIKMTSDGKPTGKSIPEQMLDVITNPDTHSEEFTMLAAQLGIYFDDKTAKLTDMKNRDTLLKFYTTDNLVKLFNKIIYVYNPEVDMPVDNIKDLSHQIGISAYVPEPAQKKNLNHPVIKFNLSNTQSDRTTYTINLFNDDGTFEAKFENKPVAREKRVTAEQKKTMTPEQLAEISFVSGKGQIYPRLRDKMVRVDKVLLARTSDKLDYKAIVFSGGRLVEQNYNSYLDYLADKQILDSTIHGLDFKATDPDTGVEQTGRTYFKDRTFWVDIPDGEAKAAKADISVKGTTSERVSGDPVVKEEPKKEVKPVVAPVTSVLDKQLAAARLVKQYGNTPGEAVDNAHAKSKTNEISAEESLRVAQAADDITTDAASFNEPIDDVIKYWEDEIAKAEARKKATPDVKNIRAKVEGIVTAPGYVKDTAQKHLPKEVNKIRQATQFIGTGEGNDSTTQRMEDAYKTVNAANTGVYTADDLIYVSSNGRRGGRVAPVVDGKLNSSYVNIEKAMAAGASFIMDTGAHLAATRNYNMGEAELAQYMQDNGYVRDSDKDTGIWRPKAKTAEVVAPVVTAPVVTAPVVTVTGENISSKGSAFAKQLTNVGNSVTVNYKGKQYVNAEHAYQTWKSGEYNQAGYDLRGGKVRGGKIGDTFAIMTDIITEKLRQHPELVAGIIERGGLEYIAKSTHTVTGDNFWESSGQNMFIEALHQAAINVGVGGAAVQKEAIDNKAREAKAAELQKELNDANKELSDLVNILEALEKKPEVTAEVAEVVEMNVTQKEVAEIIAEEPTITTTAQAQAAVTEGVVEDIAAGKVAKKRGNALQRIINKIKKIIVSLFAAGTLFTGITGFTSTSDGVSFDFNKTIEASLSVFPQTTQEMAKRYLEKKGIYESADYQVEVVEDIQEVKEPVFHEDGTVDPKMEILAAVPDGYNPTDSLIVYRSTWNNKDGFKYIPGPNRDQSKRKNNISGVVGVGHFLLDASLYGGKEYSHDNNKGFLAQAKAKNDYVPAFKRLPGGMVEVKYKRYANLDSTDIVLSPLRQYPVSSINWLSAGHAEGFKDNIKEVKRKKGEGTYLIFKTRDGYSRFSGGSVVFLFTKNGNEIVVDFAGSLNMIQKEAERIVREFEIPAESLTLGYHDVGSFSAKPKAHDGVIRGRQYYGYNDEGFTGGSLLIPIPEQAPAKEPTLPAGITTLSVLLAGIRRKQKAGQPITDDDIAKVKARIEALNTRIGDIQKELDTLREPVGSAASLIKGNDSVPLTKDNLVQERDHAVYMYLQSLDKHGFGDLTTEEKAEVARIMDTHDRQILALENMYIDEQFPPFTVPAALQRSIDARKPDEKGNVNIKLMGDGPDSYWKVFGLMHERVSSILRPSKGARKKSDAMEAGRICDTTYKKLLTGDTEGLDTSNFTVKAFEQITQAVEDFKQHMAAKDQRLASPDVVVYGDVKDSKGVKRKVAGEIDIMTVDRFNHFYVYDQKTSTKPFDLATYQSINVEAGTGKSDYDMHHEQVSSYSALGSHMTGDEAGGVGIIPGTLAYSRKAGKLIIDSYVAYPTMMYKSIKAIPDIPIKPKEVKTTDFSKVQGESNKNRKKNIMLNEDLEKEGDEVPETHENWGDDSKQPFVAPTKIDLAKFRDMRIDLHEQYEHEDFVGQLMLDFMHEDRDRRGPDAEVQSNTLFEGTRAMLEDYIREFNVMLRDSRHRGGVLQPDDTRIPLTPEEDAVKVKQIAEMQKLAEGLDETPKFIGYFKLGLMRLSSDKIIKLNIDLETLRVSGADEQDFSVRYQDNYSAKIDPKTTVLDQAKLFLSRIWETNRTVSDNDQIRFNNIPNRFGIKKYFNLDRVLDSMYIEFENVAPESFMDRLKSLNNDNPVVHSIIKTLEDVATDDPVRSKQLRYQLTGLMKQRRDQKFMKITTNEDGSVKEARMIDAARLGIKNNIFGQWDNGFRERFPTLYNFEESNDNLRDTAYTAVAKPLDLNYEEKGKTYDALNLKLPEGFDTVKYVTEKQIDWLYKELKTIAYGNSKKHMVFKFDWNSQLVVADKVMKITKQDVAMLMLSLPTKNFILTEDIKKMFPAEKQDLVADTIMRQLANNASYFSRIELKGALHEGSDWDMDLEAYPNIYYKIISDQFDRMGIQFSEKKDESWTVLRSMNNSISANGKRRVFNNFDSKAANFNQFLNTTFRKQIIEPLLIPGIFNVGQQEFIDDDAGDLTAPTKSLTVEQPLSHSLQGMDPYARHARSEWYSYINATIRNTQGDREWTYTDPNGLSTAVARLKDHKNKSGLLAQLAETPMGRYNLFLQELVRSPEALEAFTNHYIDAGKMDNYTIVDPANLNAAKSLMMLFNTYYHNESGTVERNKGGYITTHSDSSLMPTFMFGKQVIGLEFHETVAEDGTHSYKIKLPKLKGDLTTNLAYDHLYGIFRGELQRIYETFQIYKDINKADRTDQQKVDYAFSKYEPGINFIYKDGKIYPGNGINLFTFGNKMFEGDTSGIYSGVGKTGIHTSLIDASGHANEAVIEGHFQDKFLDGYLNDLLDQIQKRVDELGTSFFETTKVKELGRFAGDTKTLTLDLKPKLLDQGAFDNMRKLFERNSFVISTDGRKEGVTTRKRRIEKDYDEDDFSKEFESKEYRKMAVDDRQLVQDDDMKTSTYASLLQKYILADFAINNAIFLGSIIPMLGDPASYEMKKVQNYKSWQGQFDKRMRGFVAPGGTNAYEKNDDVYTIGFEDIKIGDILMDIDDTTKMTRGQQHFLSEWDKNIGKIRGRYPARMFDQMVFYYNLPPEERHKAWDVIKDMLNKDITDGGSYISTREFLFRQVVDGKISDDQYWDALDAYYGKDKKKLPVANKILKYVLAGSNVTSVGEFNTNKVVYQKHAETTLIPEMFEDSVLDEVRKQLDVIETRLYQGRGNGKPTPGIVLAPRSAFKVGYPNHVRLIDENGNITQDLLNAKVHKVSRSLLRKQIQSQDEAKDRGVISSQGNVLGSVNTTANQMFGQDGHVIFDRKQNDPSSTEIYYDDDNKPVRVSSSGVGITAKTIDKASIATLTQMSRMKMIDKMYELGLTQEQDEIVIKGIDRFLATIKKQAVNLYGIGSTTASFLNTVMDGGDSVLPIPVSFTPGAKRIQSVLLSEFKEIFYRFTLPGGALTQYANAMNYKKDTIKADKGLKHYRMDIYTSEKFETEEEAYKRFPPEQRHSKWDPVTGTLEYYKFSASEVIIPWPFKGLNFDDFCEKDGTPKKGRIDERLLHLITFRIPNTGPNSSGWHKVAKFTRPGMGDGISAAPEHVATIGADSDFDKLYTYLYNHKVVKDKDGNSILMKEESSLHYTQRGSDFKSPEAQRQYAKNKLMVDPVYRRLKYENKQAKAQSADLNSTFATAVGQSADDDLALFYEEQQMIAMEDAYMNTPEFGRKFARATIQEKQSMQSLENAMLDRFHAYFSDYKTLKHMTDLVTTEWLNKYITDKVVPIRQADGTITKVSIEEIMEKNEFHAITSAISFNDGRLGNTAADLVISMSANGMLSNQVGQQQNFFYNTNHIPEAHRRGYEIRFYTPTGELKEEDPLTRENSTYQGIYNPHITKDKKKNILEDVPALGLHRLDRIYAKDDDGNKVYITTPLGNSVQTSLDHQNVGLLPKINLNPTTYNGFHGLSRFGLISELVPSLLQESVVDYTKAISGFYAVKEKPYKSDALIDTVTKFATSYGYDRSKISSIFYSLPDSVKTGPAFVQAVMDRIDPLQRIKAKTEDLLIDIAIQYGWTQKDNDYGLRQLEALRHFLIMNNVGTDLNTTGNATSAYRSGLNSTMAGLDMQDLSLNHLHQYQDGDKKIVSSAPLVGGKHRLLYKWAKELGRKYEHHPSMASFGHDNGVVQSKQMLASLQGKIFTEFTPMFEMARKKIFWMGMGANPKKSLADMRKSDYEHVFNKVNVNLVAFIMSNPNLYRNLFQSQEEYNLFETYRGELMSRPHKDIPYQDHFILFNKPVSLAKELHDFARKTNPSTGRPYMADHEALVALKSRLQVSYKTPSSVTYDTNFGYNENVNMRIALSLMDMYFHGGAEAKNMVKKLIINAYMSGGITTTHSYVQFIAPEMLFKFQFHDVLRGIIKGYNDKAFIEDFVDSYVLHYFQHFPFEMKGELDMQYVDGDEKVDSKGVPYYDLRTDPRTKKWALKKTLFRKDHRMFVKSANGKRIEMVDNLGMNSWNTTEFRFNTEKVPGNSLYASNITNKTRIRKEGIELEGEIGDDVENINETEASKFEDRKQVALFDKVVAKPTNLDELITDIEVDGRYPMQAGVLDHFRPLFDAAGIKVEYSGLEGQPKTAGQFDYDKPKVITINTNYTKFKGLEVNNPDQFNMDIFVETIAHEGAHALTYKTVYDVKMGIEKDPKKIQAVERLEALVKSTMKYIRSSKELSEKYPKLMDMGKKVAKYYNQKIEDITANEIRLVGEFIAHTLSVEGFQEDLNGIILKGSNDSVLKQIFDFIMELLGLNIDAAEAQTEIKAIQRALTPGVYYSEGGLMEKRVGTVIPKTIKNIQEFSALHVALREILNLRKSIKGTLEAGNFNQMFQTIAEIAKENSRGGQKLNYEELYSTVPNFDPSWSQDMKAAYHQAASNGNIIC